MRLLVLPSVQRRLMTAFFISFISLLCLAGFASAQSVRGYLGVEAHDLTPQELASLKLTQGVSVARIADDSPAAQAGLQEHDIILSFDGQAVADRNQLQALVQGNPGRVVKLGVLRGTDSVAISVKIGGQEIPIDQEAQEQAQVFGRGAFARCTDPPDTYCMGPFQENRLDCEDTFSNPPRHATTCEMTVQIHATAADPVSAQGTTEVAPAEMANGLRWKGTIRFAFDRWRKRYKANGVWLPWEEWKDAHDIDNQPSILVAMLFKKNGQWLASDMRMSGVILNTTSPPTGFGDLMRSATNQGFRETMGVYDPLPVDQLMAKIKQPSCEEIFTGKRPVQVSPVQELKNRTLSGTADDFAAALPGLIEQAAYAARIDPKIYSKETDFIIATVRTCAQITPEMYAKQLGSHRLPDLSVYGEQYRICNRGRAIAVSDRVGHTLGPGERAIELVLEGVGGYGQSGRGFHVIVSFSWRQGDSYSNYAFENYGIAAANVYPTAAKH